MWERSPKVDFWRWNGDGNTFEAGCTVIFNQDGSADVEMVIGEASKQAYKELMIELKKLGVKTVISKRNGVINRRHL